MTLAENEQNQMLNDNILLRIKVVKKNDRLTGSVYEGIKVKRIRECWAKTSAECRTEIQCKCDVHSLKCFLQLGDVNSSGMIGIALIECLFPSLARNTYSS